MRYRAHRHHVFAGGKARDQIVELEHEPDAFAWVGGEARLVARGQVVIEVVRGAGMSACHPAENISSVACRSQRVRARR